MTSFRFLSLSMLCLLVSIHVSAQRQQVYRVQSPNDRISVMISDKDSLSWSVSLDGSTVIEKGKIGMVLAGGECLGCRAKVSSTKTTSVKSEIKGINYKRSVVADVYNELTLSFTQRYKILFRVYDDAVAYRFVTARKDSLTITDEIATFQFPENHHAYVPYANARNDIYTLSFENTYEYLQLESIKRDTLSFLPVLVEGEGTVNVVLTEADLENYPGMFVRQNGRGFKGVYAPFALQEVQAPGKNRQAFVTKRANYIARTSGTKSFPWRVAVITDDQKKLLDNDVVYKLAEPSRIKDVSWIRPGKVAWDWWNDWNISGVDFKAGVNTQTYKYYIDFAAEYGIEYILLDEGWARNNELMDVVPEIDLQEIIRYATAKNVGVWLWAGWLPLEQKMDAAFTKYAGMGIVGFKIDFMDRDDQRIVQFYYRVAEKAAKHKMMLDLHGAYKPTGLHRTYPNVLNFEGVFGLENVKWTNIDFPQYDCTIPFIRMLAGPMDYTPGAMGNATKANFHPSHSSPVSQGTRCHQLALYVLYESPLVMLSDNPTNYQREKESTTFITSIPTTFDETVAVNGKVSEYATIARRKGTSWYIGSITNWTGRTLEIDFSFLKEGVYEMEFFQDGINSGKNPADYSRKKMTIKAGDKINIQMSAGGGWAAKLTRVSQ